MICKVDLCNKKSRCLGFCKNHYDQYRKYGRIRDYDVPRGRYCCIDSCNKHSGEGQIVSLDGKHYCLIHYRDIKRNGCSTAYHIPKPKHLKPIKKFCTIDGCDRKHMANGYCSKHYQQIKTYGYGLHRTIRDKNGFIILDNETAVMNIYSKNGVKVAEALIDIDDIPRVSKYKWHLTGSGEDEYIASTINGKFKSLHRYILNYDDELIVDHINRNPKDNRKSNLRIATHSQNLMNTKTRSNNTSGVKGVWYSNTHSRWVAQITVDGKVRCKYLRTKDEAIQKRKEMELEYHGEFAPSWWEENKC